MQEVRRAALLALLLIAGCAPKATPAPSATPTSAPAPSPTATAVPHAAQIRFALIGTAAAVNVWALFDATGDTYNAQAVMSTYWPRLYRLSVPDRDFEPMAAGGMPAAFQQQGGFSTAAVPLRSDLKWTDGSPFSADDVAFTVNTALAFQLGFDWPAFYDPDLLDHAAALDAHTVQFYFKRQPDPGAWQYGALQGPIVQKAYWAPRVAAAQALLPSADLTGQIAALSAQAADMQSKIDALNADMAKLAANSPAYAEDATNIRLLQPKLNETNTALAKAQAQSGSAMAAARAALFALESAQEPTLGDWMPAAPQGGARLNEANPAHPFGMPHFDRVQYAFFADEASAVRALQAGAVDAILAPGGISSQAAAVLSASDHPITVWRNRSPSLRFLVFNSANASLTDETVRTALACLFGHDALASPALPEAGLPPPWFVLPDEKFWYRPPGAPACQGSNGTDDLQKAAALLKASGYSWNVEPREGKSGSGLRLAGGAPFPALTLLASRADAVNLELAGLVQKRLAQIGITLNVNALDGQDVDYAVFSSGQYDLAVLGWRVSEYPGYLCEWFQPGNPFGYQSAALASGCQALHAAGDLAAAQQALWALQSTLGQEWPFIPLYSALSYDASRGLAYPFDHVPGGLSGIYGAPALAIPAP